MRHVERLRVSARPEVRGKGQDVHCVRVVPDKVSDEVDLINVVDLAT